MKAYLTSPTLTKKINMRKKLIDSEPMKFNKQGFIRYLMDNGVVNGMLTRIENIPDIIHVDNYDYVFNSIATWRKKGHTYHEFELNYYSEENMEFLLTYKIFNDVEVSLNFLECELLRRGFLDANIDCKY